MAANWFIYLFRRKKRQFASFKCYPAAYKVQISRVKNYAKMDKFVNGIIKCFSCSKN